MIEWGEDFFAKKEIDSPKTHIELIIRHVLGYDRLSLYTKYDRPFTQDELELIRDMVKRRVAGEPLQYILGEQEFYNINLKCDKRALIPRPETEEMVEQISTYAISNKFKPEKILDVGTGSGAIALSLAKEFPVSEVIGIDISEKALELAKFNQIRNNIENVSFFQADILEVTPKGKYDIVVSNPPYIPKEEFHELQEEVRKYEPYEALISEGEATAFHKRLVTIFPNIVSDKGELWMEFMIGQAREIIDMCKSNNLRIEIFKDMQRIERYCRVTR